VSEDWGRIRVCAVEGVGLQWVQFPPGNWVAPAGSYRSGGGGNETVGAFETDGSLGDSASRQAVTRVNVEQASKRPMWRRPCTRMGKAAVAEDEWKRLE
jgi:hypothetical protein